MASEAGDDAAAAPDGPPPAFASLDLPPARLESRGPRYDLWKRVALQEPALEPPAEAEAVPLGFREMLFEAERMESSPSGDHIHLRGKVVVTYREYVLTADEATIDAEGQVADFRGNVRLRSPEREATGDGLRLNLVTRAWEMRRARTVISPESVERGLLGPVFVEGEVAAGEPGELTLLRGGVTTCDLPHPHYQFRVRRLLVYPGRRLILRDATLYVLGRRVLPPQDLSLPLREWQRPTYLPEVGRNDAEGVYVKYARPYRVSSLTPGLLKLDLLEKRGFGTGIDQPYRVLGGVGTLLLYNLLPRAGVPQETSGRLQHSQQFGSLRADFTGDYRESAYQYSVGEGLKTTSLNTNLNLSRQVGGSSTTLGINQALTSTAGTFRNLTANLLHNQQFDSRTTATFGADYLSSDTDTTAENAQLNSRMELRRRGRAVDLLFAANDTHTISGLGQFAGIERLPEIALQTDTLRFRRGSLSEEWPARLQLSVGRYHEQPNDIDTERALLDVNLSGKRWDWDRSQVTLNAGFRQGFYGDGSAQYVVSGNTRYSYLLGRHSEFSLAHIYQEAEGFTPFRFDFPYAFNRVESLLSLRRGERLGIALRTGYDLRGGTTIRWQPLTVQSFWKPDAHSLLTLGTSYNLNSLASIAPGFPQSRFQTVVSELRIRRPNGLKLDVGVRYDPARSRFAAVKTQIDTSIGQHWRLAALVGYDGFTRFNDFMITRDLHCLELAIVRIDHRDWRRDQGWQIYLRIKAFPTPDRFGLGQSGQAIDTSVGQVY